MKDKTAYICSECDYKSAKWYGKCPSCGSWNTFEEYTPRPESPRRRESRPTVRLTEPTAVTFPNLSLPEYIRATTSMSELDRVLGGGLVSGSVVLLAGEPGIGKSTLLTQISDALSRDRRVLYVSGEESPGQLKLRADRLGVVGEEIFVLTETNIDAILDEAQVVNPGVIIIDSIQTVYCDNVTSAPGSVTQVKECALRLIEKAKGENVSIILVGHVNKEGGIAGPKVLEHMVDAVLYFEGERQSSYRIIRAVKNRFGSIDEIGVFEMTEVGLREVKNPSEVLLADRPVGVSGNCAVCVIEGTRPIIAEVQALVTTTSFPSPKRTVNGVDYNRLCLLLAVLEKRLGLRFSTQDVYVNVIGGLKLGDPTIDLALALALISGIRDIPVPDDLIAMGEVGLSGECRAVANLDPRIKEAIRLGFTKIVIPSKCKLDRFDSGDASFIAVKNLFELLSSKQIFIKQMKRESVGFDE